MPKITRRQFVKGTVGGIAGASLFSTFGKPFLFAQTKEPIKVGYLEPMTGIFATLGIGMLKGAELAEKHINAAGGIMGRPVRRPSRPTEPAPWREAAHPAARLLFPMIGT